MNLAARKHRPSRLRRTFPPVAQALGALLLLSLGCAPPPPVEKASIDDVVYTGCDEVLWPGPVCQLDRDEQRPLHFYPRQPANRIEVSIDGHSVMALRHETPQGPYFAVKVPFGAEMLDLVSRSNEGVRAWQLALRDRQIRPEWLKEAFEMSQKPAEIDAARRLLDEHLPGADLEIRARALSMRARMDVGDPSRLDEGLHLLKLAIEARRAAGQRQGEARDVDFLAQKLIEGHRFREARGLLNQIAIAPGEPADASYYLVSKRGLLARFQGEYRVALTELEEASKLASRVGLGLGLNKDAEQHRALLLTGLGRFQEANAIFASLLDAEFQGELDCFGALKVTELLTNRGWLLYLAAEAGRSQGDPATFYQQALKIIDRVNCPELKVKQPNLELSTALVYLQQAPLRLREAEASLRAAEPSRFSPALLQRLGWEYARGKLALKQGAPEEALRHFLRLEEEAVANLAMADRWRAAYGKAQAHLALRRMPEAVADLQVAEGQLDSQLASIPLAEGKESFVDQWEAGTRLLVDLLLRLDRPAEALRVARVARARVFLQLAAAQRLSSLDPAERELRDSVLEEYWKIRDAIDRDAAEDWSRSKGDLRRARGARAEQYRASLSLLDHQLSTVSVPGGSHAPSRLPPLRRDELVLAYFPLSEAGSWVGFAHDGQSLTWSRISLPKGPRNASLNRSTLAEKLLTPFEERIRPARRLRILPYGELQSVPFHALPFGDDILLARRTVVYGLDIVAPLRTRGRSQKALVISDPSGNLPGARIEGAAIEQALSDGWKVHKLPGADATSLAVRKELRGNDGRGIDLLHFAGHADSSGRGGWESYIPLAEKDRMTLGDILGLRPAPTWVVLSGCETGQTDETARVESQGLAQAFLLAGSEVVVAATRKIDDVVAQRLMTALYHRIGKEPNFPELLQKAQLQLRTHIRSDEWESFRVFVP